MNRLFALLLILVAFASASASFFAYASESPEKVKLTKEEKKALKTEKKRLREMQDSIKEANARWLDYGTIDLHFVKPGMLGDSMGVTTGILQVRFGKKTQCRVQFKGIWYDAESYRQEQYHWRFKEAIDLNWYYFNIPNDMEHNQPHQVFSY